MATVMQRLRCGFLNNFNSFYFAPRQDVFKVPELTVVNIQSFRHLKSQAADAELIEQASLIDETALLPEDNIDNTFDLEKKRDKSRLRLEHRNILYDQVPYSESKAWYHDTVKYKRKTYGRYGEASGVNPGIMWPTREELKEAKEYEAVAFSESLQQMIENNALKKKEAAAAIKARDEDIMKKFGKLEQWKSDVRNKISKKLADAQAAKDRKDRLVEEVRRHFGFKVDPREDRFKEMLEMKEKAEKKTVKEAKKKAKEAKMIAKLTDIKTDAETK